ncbi:YczE/YyaS/YitT family protein [Salinithrix halophila]|uniref:YitT family protein n=1 Tax=Salinithrix halophila TaxID=1485204 RepID=A0ABV8JD52_9BACL
MKAAVRTEVKRGLFDWKQTDWRVFSVRWGAFMAGIMVMALGIAVMIRAQWGLAPWDVFHMGLAINTPLTVGTWLQIVGLVLITAAAVIDRKLPGPGAVLNMILVGWLVDHYLAQPWMQTPVDGWGQGLMMLAGLLLVGIGNGLYIAPRLGAGPRDGVVMALSERWGFSISRVRMSMELSVLAAGWFLGGPVFVGTVLFSVLIGPMMQTSIRFWEKMIEQWLRRGVSVEDIH